MNRVVLVTGASRGLGLAIAKKFLKDKDIVYVNYNNTPLEKLEEKYQEFNNAKFIKCDVSNEDDVKSMMNKIKKEYGHLDVLVNNAAICKDNEFYNKTSEEFQEVLKTNLIGPFLACKYIGELMVKGSIINISSTNGIDTNETYAMDYDASKAGLISLTHNFAKVLSPNIRVNSIAPGWINTETVNEMEPHYLESEKDKIMLERFAEPEEIANVVFFLASNEASYITDSIIRVDGGLK